MLDWFLSVNGILREPRKKVGDALDRLANDDEHAAKIVNGYMVADYIALKRTWENMGFDTEEFGALGRHIRFGERCDYKDILEQDLPIIERVAEKHAREGTPAPVRVGFEDLLHPVIFTSAYQQYRDGYFRDAVLNAILAVFDLLRERTGLALDGQALVTQALSLDSPMLVISDIGTESGRNDQKGFIQMLSGAYIGIRNSKAHSLQHDLDINKAAQYLIFASLLARRVSEAKEAKIA